MKAGDFVARNFAGTQTGVDAAVSYCGSSGYVQIGPGLGSLAPTSFPTGVSVVRADSTGWSILGNASLYIRSAYKGLNGATDPSIYSDQTISLTGKAANYAQKSMDIVQRFSDSTSAAGLSLNVAHFINRFGVLGVGGGDVETGMGVGAYAEHRGNSVITGALYGAENATTMYSGGSIVTGFGSLNTAQITTGANAKITTAIGSRGIARIYGGAGQITTAYGVSGIAGTEASATGTITDAIGARFEIEKSGGTITNATGLVVPAITQGANNNFGLRVSGAASGGSNINQSLRIDAGESYLGGKVIITDSLRVQSRVLVADSVSCNGTGRFSGDGNFGFANASTTAATIRVNGGSSGTTAQRILILRNNTTDMALQANGTAEFLQYNHNLAFGTPAGTTFAVMNGSGQLRLGDGNVATHDIETLHSGLITDSLRVNKGLYLGGQFINKVLRASATLDFDLSALITQDLTITVTGAALNDEVVLGVPNGSITTTAEYAAWVSSANTVTVRCRTNVVGENPASGTFKVTVIQ